MAREALASQEGRLEAGGGVKHVPQPYPARHWLYTMHLAFGFVSRMWEMGIVLLIAAITNNSLFFVALAGFFSSLTQCLIMSPVGAWLDRTDRLVAVRFCLITKLSVITTSYLLCALLTTSESTVIGVVVFLLPILYAAAGVSIATITQSVEKDWIVVLSDGDSVWLSQTNSAMTQIDLFCASAAPAVTGILFSMFSRPISALFLLCSNGFAVWIFFYFMSFLYRSNPGLMSRATVRTPLTTVTTPSSPSSPDASYDPIAEDKEAKLRNLIARLGESDELEQAAELEACTVLSPSRPQSFPWKQLYSVYDAVWEMIPLQTKAVFSGVSTGLIEFGRSGVAGPMLAYSMLYCTVLCFGDLMVVYLRYEGVSDYWLGVSKGCSALFGFAGATAFPRAKEQYGLRTAGHRAVWAETFFIVIAATSSFWLPPSSAVTLLIIMVLFSRTGLWLFDLVVRQIAQEGIQESVRGKVNGTWSSITSFFECLGYIFALLLPHPSTFWILSLISAAMVLGAAIVFQYSNPSATRPWAHAIFTPLAGSSHHGSGAVPEHVSDSPDEDDSSHRVVETITFSPMPSPSEKEDKTNQEPSARRTAFRKVGRKSSPKNESADVNEIDL